MTLLEALKNGEYININNFHLIEKELKSKPNTYIHQYNVSPTWLLHEYRVTEYKGSTIIYKLKPFAQANIAQIEMLPTGVNPLKFIDEVKSIGMTIRLTDSEITELNLDRSQWKLVDNYGGDFVYSKSNNHNIEGKDNEYIRTGINRLLKNPDFDVSFYKPSEITSILVAELHTMLNEYKAYKKSTGNKTQYTFHIDKYVDNIRSWNTPEYNDKRVMLVIKHKGHPMAFSISEYMNDTNISMIDRKSMLHTLPKMQHAFRAINWFEIDYWVKQLNHNQDIYFNFGSAGGSDALKENKRRLKPHCLLDVYKLKETGELHKDLLDIIRPKKSNTRILW